MFLTKFVKKYIIHLNSLIREIKGEKITMMVPIKFDKEQIKKEVEEFRGDFKSVILGTKSKNGDVVQMTGDKKS